MWRQNSRSLIYQLAAHVGLYGGLGHQGWREPERGEPACCAGGVGLVHYRERLAYVVEVERALGVVGVDERVAGRGGVALRLGLAGEGPHVDAQGLEEPLAVGIL